MFRRLKNIIWNSPFMPFILRHSKSSKRETFCKNILKDLGLNFKSQLKIKEFGRKAFIDFVVYLNDRTIFIEYNGRQHYEYTPYFHKGGEIDFVRQQNRDVFVRNYCKKHNYELIEIPYWYTNDQIKDVLSNL